MLRTRIVWTGVAGSPYYSTFYWNGDGGTLAQEAQDQTIAYAAAAAGFVRTGLTMTVESEVLEVNHVTGESVTLFNVAGSTSVGANTNQPLPFQVQALTTFGTAGFRRGRRIRGRSFLPGLTEEVNSTGVGPDELPREQIQSLYSEVLVDGLAQLVVWSRPIPPGVGEPGATGETTLVTSYQTNAVWSALRTRRAD